MKHFRQISTVILLSLISSIALSAQPSRSECPEGRPERKEVRTPEARAKHRTDDMDKIVDLSDKQYKKIYKIYLKEETARESAMQQRPPMGPPHQSGGGFGGDRMGGPGAPPPGNMMGGRPPHQHHPPHQRVTVGGKDIESDEYIDEREKKFRKILSAEQYKHLRNVLPDPSGYFNR